jgi:peptide/nickel transport system ATP-binding protein
LLIEDVSFHLETESVLALVGESGSGKTTLCRAISKLFPSHAQYEIRGTAFFNDSVNLLHCNDDQLRHIRRTQLRYIFQEPQQALNPSLKIRRQLELASCDNSPFSHDFTALLNMVGLSNAADILHSYPHQLSIGMAQRVMIAMAILPAPRLLIADEPTSAVDASLRYQLLDILKSLQRQNHMTMLLVTHDLSVAKKYADTIAILKDGRLLEYANTSSFFDKPKHPYSQMLLNAMPSADKRIHSTLDTFADE